MRNNSRCNGETVAGVELDNNTESTKTGTKQQGRKIRRPSWNVYSNTINEDPTRVCIYTVCNRVEVASYRKTPTAKSLFKSIFKKRRPLGFGVFIAIWSMNTLQRHNTQNLNKIFPGKELRGLSPKFHIHVSVSNLYIPRIGLLILLQENMWSDHGNI